MSAKMIKYLVETAIPNLRAQAKTYDEIRQYLTGADFATQLVDAAIRLHQEQQNVPCIKLDLGTHCVVLPESALDIAKHEGNKYEQARVLRRISRELGFHVCIRDAMQISQGEYL